MVDFLTCVTALSLVMVGTLNPKICHPREGGFHISINYYGSKDIMSAFSQLHITLKAPSTSEEHLL